MPTDFLRSRAKPHSSIRPATAADANVRIVQLRVGGVILDIALSQTTSAGLVWAALPLRSVAEPWGEVLHFELPVRAGRDRGARINGRLGEVYYWPEERRVMIPFGPTPISRSGEIRLPQPLNVLGSVEGAQDVLQALRTVRASEMVSLERVLPLTES